MATFGKTTLGAEWLDMGNAGVYVSRFTAPEDMVINAIVAYLAWGRLPRDVIGVVYDDLNGQPKNLLGGSPIVTQSVDYQWVRFPVNVPAASGQKIHIGVLTSISLYSAIDAGEAGQTNRGVRDSFPNIPADFGTPTLILDSAMSVYAEYTPLVPPPTVRLTFNSNITINATVNGTSVPSGGYIDVPQGTQVTISAPPSAVGYSFDRWLIGSQAVMENPFTTIVSQATTITAVYVPQIVKHILNVDSNITGVPFTARIGGTALSYVTPFSGQLDEGTYEITMPAQVMVGGITFVLLGWNDGAASPVKTISLLADMVLSVTYLASTGTLSVDTTPVKGEIFVDGASWGAAPQSRTVPGLATYLVTFGPVSGYTAPQSVEADVSLGGTRTVLGTYTLIPPPPPVKGTLSIDTVPIKGGVFVDGAFIGFAPAQLQLNPATYTVSFGNLQGYTTPTPVPAAVEAGMLTEVIGTYALVPTATLAIHAFDQGLEVIADGRIVETGQEFTTPATIQVNPGFYNIEITYNQVVYVKQADAVVGKTVNVQIVISGQAPGFNRLWLLPIGFVSAAGIAIISGSGKKKK